jgi:hypothetical protein
MKVVLLTLIVALAFCSCSRSPVENSSPGEPTVKQLGKPLPTDEQKKEEFLITTMAKEEHTFEAYTTDNWKSNFTVFAKALVQKADQQNLNSASLRSVLDLVLKDAQDRIAYLPVRAFQTSYAGEPIWIIVVKWEHPIPEMGTLPLGHVRAFAFEQKTSKQVGFATCN